MKVLVRVDGMASRAFAGLLCVAACLAGATRVGAETFRYAYDEGEKYRILSTVNEDVYVDRALSHQAEILNRISVEVGKVEKTAGAGTQAELAANFQTSERSVGVSGATYQWAREYDSVFLRDDKGRYEIEPVYWMPVVRDVPVFPDKDLKPGDSWSAPGEEVHDFRDSFSIAEPYRIRFTANYTFLGEVKLPQNLLVSASDSPTGASGGTTLSSLLYPAFTVSYRIFDEPAAPKKGGKMWPVRIMGASDQKVYWDRQSGRPAAYEERFRMIFELSNGATVEYRGTAKASIIESIPMDREQMAADIAKDIERLDIADTEVRVTEEGVAISLEDIRFQADSAVLLPSEQAKLDQIADILKRYEDRDILVGGHTALAGTEAGRQKLSEERAASVASYLIGTGTRKAERVVVRGYGATKPVADNSTETGKKKNRRVEITILEN